MAERQVATLRFNFPFMQAGRRRVDSIADSVTAIAGAAALGAAHLPGLPCYLGGHSFGGRMSTHAAVAAAAGELPAAPAPAGLVLLAFPLHPAGRPGVERAAHLPGLRLPMLFVSGSRDALARADLLTAVVSRLPAGRLYWLDDADHGYRARKSRRRQPQPVLEEAADAVAGFVAWNTAA